MKINKYRYKIINESEKYYIEESEEEARIKINSSLMRVIVDDEDELRGAVGRYLKYEGLYRLKYIYTRNKQLQPQTFDRYFYLLDICEDEKGVYIQYALVYDKLFEPLIRITYILAALGIIAYLFYAYSVNAMSRSAAVILSVIVAGTVVIMFKKSKESSEECANAEKYIQKFLKNL